MTVQLAAPAGYVVPAGAPPLALSGIHGHLADGGNQYEAVSDDDGTLVFENVATGTFTLWVAAPGDSDLLGGDWRDGVLGSEIGPSEIDVGETAVSLGAVFTRGALLRGVVLDDTGTPVAGATVGQSTTDATGAFLSALSVGQRDIWVQAPENSTLLGGYWAADDRPVTSDYTKRGFVTVGSDLTVIPRSITVRLARGGTIAGTILDSDGGAVAQAEVSAGSAHTVTANDGSYMLSGLWPGDYVVYVTPSAPFQVGGFISTNGAVTTSNAPRYVRILGTETVGGIDGRVSEGGDVRGHIDGLPADVRVSVNATAPGVSARYATSDAAGDFAFSGLAPGNWTLNFAAYDTGGTGPVNLVVPSTTINVAVSSTARADVVAVTGGSISGALESSEGEPVGSGTVTALRPDNSYAASGSVNLDGTFHIVSLATGSYVLSYSTPAGSGRITQPISVTAGHDSAAGTVKLAPAGSAVFTVVGADGAPVAGASVWVYANSPGGGSGSGTTGADGTVTIGGLTGGDYGYSVNAAGYIGEYGNVDVVPGSTAQVAVALGSAASLSLLVQDDGTPLPGRTIAVRSTSDGLPQTSQTDSRGIAQLTLAPGEYIALLPTRTGQWGTTIWSANPQSEAFTIAAGANSRTVTLDDSYAIDLTVRDGDGAPVASTWATIVRDAESVSIQTDASGTVRIDGLTAGDYTLSADVEGAQVYFDGVTDPSQATPVTLSADAKSRAVVIAPHTGSLVRVTGVVTDTAGNPLDGERVQITSRDEDGNWTDDSSATTGDDGAYRTWVTPGAAFTVLAATGDRSIYAPERIEGEFDGFSDLTVDVELEVGLEAAGVIRGGTPKDPLGDTDTQPVANSYVSVWFDGVSRTASTAADGSYTLRGLTAAAAAGNGSAWGPDEYFIGRSLDSLTGTHVLELGGALTSHVGLAGGATGDVTMVLERDGSQIGSWTASVDSDGQDRPWSQLRAGAHRLTFSSPGWITETVDIVVEPGKRADLGDITLEKVATVAGAATAGGVPVRGVTVDAIRDGTVIATTTTGDDGGYAFDALPTGGITVEASWQEAAAASTKVTLTSGQHAAVPLALDTAVVRSVVRFTLSGSDDANQLVWGTIGGDRSPSTWISNGLAQFVNVDPGSTRFWVGPDSRYLGGWLTADGRVVDTNEATAFTVGNGSTYLDIAAHADRPATVVGTVRDADGAPVAGATVSVGEAQTATDGNGEYALSYARPGDRIVRAGDDDQLFVTGTAAAALVEDAPRTVDFSLVRYGEVSATVADVDGEPVADARVWASAEEQPTRIVRTGPDGLAVFTGLRDVDYTFFVDGPGTTDIDSYLGGGSEPGEAATLRARPGEALSVGHTLLRTGALDLSIDVVDDPAGEQVRVELLDPADKSVVKSTDWSVPVDAVQSLSGVAPGSYLVRVTGGYFPDTYLAASGQTTDAATAEPVTFRGEGVTVDRALQLARTWVDSSTDVTDPPSAAAYGERVRVDVAVTVAEAGRADALHTELWIDGTQVDTFWVSSSGGEFPVTLPRLNAGTHTVEFRTVAAGAVRSSTDVFDIAVTPAAPTVRFAGWGWPTYGTPVTVRVEVTLADGAPEGLVADVRIDDDTYVADVIDGWATVELPATLPVGEYDVTATVRATSNTTEVTIDDVFTVAPYPSSISVSIANGVVEFGGDVRITADVTAEPYEATGEVSVLLGDDEIATAPVGSEIIFPARRLGTGSHDLTVRYSGTSTIAKAVAGVHVEVTGQPTTTTITGVDSPVEYGAVFDVEVTVAADSGDAPGGTVTVRADGRSASGTVEDGVATIEFPADLDAGAHALVAEFAPEGDYQGSVSPTVTVDVVAAASVVAVTPPAAGTFGSTTPLAVRVTTTTDADADGVVRAYVDGVEVASAELQGGQASLELPGTVPVGTHDVVVGYDGSPRALAGESAVVRWQMRTGPPVVDVTVSRNLVPLPVGGLASIDLGVTATGDGVSSLSYRVWWGDGSAVVTGRYRAPLELTHSYSSAGRYVVRVEIEAKDGSRTFVTAHGDQVVVYADEPLTAAAGDPQRSVAGDTVWFDASASRPSAAIDRVEWDFGDGTTGTGWQVSHAYAAAGEYTVTLTVGKADAAATAMTTVSVAEPTVVPGVAVTVRSGSALVQGATVTHIAADGARIQAVSGADGLAHLTGLADGTLAIYVTAPGYLPVAGEVVVAGGEGWADVTLVSGDVAATTLEHRTLTYQEIVDRGIDVDDPANQNVFLAEIHLAIIPPEGGSSPTPEDAPNVELGYNADGEIVYIEYLGSGWGTGGGGGNGGVYGGYSYSPTIVQADGVQAVQWMIIPVKGSWLKEFFEVRLVIQNLASTDFRFTDGQAELNLPDGLVLAPTAAPQQRVVEVSAIPGGQSATVYWTLRGDREGEYGLTARYTGVLAPVGEPIDITAEAERPLKVWGGSAIEWSVKADPSMEDLDPFRITVTMTNRTPEGTGVAVYGPSFQVLQGEGFLLSPETEYTKSVPVLYPGESVQMDYVFHSRRTGTVNVDDPGWEQSFIVPTGGNVQPEVGPITLHDERTEALDIATAWSPLPSSEGDDKQGLAIAWETVNGATDYTLWGRDSLDDGEWALVTDGVREGLDDARVISEDSAQIFSYYTVISHFADGSTKPAHRIVTKPEKLTGIAPRDVINVSDQSSLTLGGQCYDVLMLGVAGSGEQGTIGAPVGVISDRLGTALTGPGGVPYRSVRSVYLEYPAAAVPIFGSMDVSISEYIGSIDMGIANLKTFLESRFAQCANEKLVLAGYSQGALVISRVLNEYRADGDADDKVPYERFGGIYLVANPGNWLDNGGTRLGTAATSGGLLGVEMQRLPEKLEDITVSLCDAYDIVCAISDTATTAAVGAAMGGGGWTALGLTAYGAVRGYKVHTTYAQDGARGPTLRGMADTATHHLLGMPVPASDIRIGTVENTPFVESPIELKYLRPDVRVTWDLGRPCEPVPASGPGETTEVPTLTVERNTLQSGTVSGTATPPGYFECQIVATGEYPAHARKLWVEVRSGWAAIAAVAEPRNTVGEDYVLQPLGTRVLDAAGNPVAGAEVYFWLTGPATFADGTQIMRAVTDAQGYAVSTTPVAVPGESGVVGAKAEVPGLDPIDLAPQEILAGLPDDVTAAVTPAIEDGEVVLDVSITNGSESPLSARVETDFDDAAAEIGAGELTVLRFASGTDRIDKGAVLVSVILEGVEYRGWISYGAFDRDAVSLKLTASDTTTAFGEPVTFTVEATSAAGTPAGAVSLVVDGETVGAVELDGDGHAGFAALVLDAGTHSVVARHGSGARTAESSAVAVRVTRATSTTALNTATDPVLFGETGQVVVTVTGAGVSAGDEVTLEAAGADLATATIEEGDLVPAGARLSIPVGAVDLGIGLHSLIARYVGNGNALGSTSAPADLAVLVPTRIDGSVDDVSSGTAGALEIEVVPDEVDGVDLSAYAVSGTITVTADGWAAPITAAVTDRRATIALPARQAGDLELTVSYGGSGPYAVSTATVVSHVTTVTSTTSLQLSAADAAYGEPVTAEIDVELQNGEAATGVVDLHLADEAGAASGAPLATAALSNGAATLSLPRLGQGEHELVAVFRPEDAQVEASVSEAARLRITPLAPTLSVALERDTITFGEEVRGAVAVTAVGGAVAGTVTVEAGGVKTNATLDGTRWTFALAGLAVGSHDVDVTFTPTSGDYANASGRTTATVALIGTSLVAELDRSRVAIDDAPVEVRISHPAAAGDAVTVAWGEDTEAVVLDDAGAAVFTLPALPVGTYTVMVSFAGSDTVAPSTVRLAVIVDSAAGAVTATPHGARLGLETPSVSVGFTGTGAFSPTGTVSIRDADDVLASGRLVSGRADIDLPDLPVGSHELTVEYGGDAQYAASTAPVVVVVSKAPSRLDVTWPSGQTFGQSSRVAVAVAIDGTPEAGLELPAITGTVELRIDDKVVSAASADAAVALAVPADLDAGSHAIEVRYAGSPEVQEASVAGTLVVSPAATTISTDGAATAVFGQNVPIRIDVHSLAGEVAGDITITAGDRTWAGVLAGGSVVVTIATSDLGVGAHELRITYGGSAHLAPSTTVHRIVVEAAASTTVAVLQPTAEPSGVVAIATTVTAGDLPVTGVVTATSSTGPAVTGSLVGGRANLVVPVSIADGVHVYTVAFAGTGSIAPSTAAPVTFRVDRGTPPGEPEEPGGPDEPGDVTIEAGSRLIAAGGQQTVVVRGLEPGVTAHVFLHSDPIYLGTVTAGPDGVATLTFTVPANLVPGDHRIEVRTATGSTSVWISVTPAVTDGEGDGDADGAGPIPSSEAVLPSTGLPSLTVALGLALGLLAMGLLACLAGLVGLRRRRVG